MKFNLASFVNKMKKADTLDEDQVHWHIRTMTVMRMIFDNHEATKELLSSCTVEEIERVFDCVLFWPDWEADLEWDDYNHPGFQHVQLRELISDLGRKKSIKRKVTFL